MRQTLLLLLLGTAQGHQPTSSEGETFDIERPIISHAVYGTFHSGDEVFRIELDYETPFAQPYELLVPHQRRWKEHRPIYAVVGPGLPAPTAEELALLPEALPAGMGVYLDLNDDPERLVIFESFTRRMFWSSTPIALTVQAGRTEVWIWSPEGTTGDFTFGFGVEEDFSGGFGDVFANWGTYAY